MDIVIIFLFMGFFKLNDFVADKHNAKQVESKTDPENLDLILGDKCGEPGDSQDGHQIYQVMDATGDHGHGGGGA